MHMGASAIEAVHVAAKVDIWTAEPIVGLALKDTLPISKAKDKKVKSKRDK